LESKIDAFKNKWIRIANSVAHYSVNLYFYGENIFYMTIRDRYIQTLNSIVGRDKPFRNLVAYVNATGDNYSTLSKVMNPGTYADLQPTLKMCENLCLHSDVNGHWLLVGKMPKASATIPAGKPTKDDPRMDTLEKRLIAIEKSLVSKAAPAVKKKK
jgi:hypothetical protein